MTQTNFTRILNGIFSQSFLQKHTGKKVIFYPQDMGKPSVDKKDTNSIFIPCVHQWQYTPTAQAPLNETENFHIGKDCDYVVLLSDDFVIYFGKSLGGYCVYHF